MKVKDIKGVLAGENEMVIIDSATCKELTRTDDVVPYIRAYEDCEVLEVRSESDNTIAVYINDPHRVRLENQIGYFADSINKLLGREIVTTDLESEYIEVCEDIENAYTIVCDDEDDMFNTLSHMLEGVRLCIAVRG